MTACSQSPRRTLTPPNQRRLLPRANSSPARFTSSCFPRELTVVPRPVQTPHPPVRIAANSPDTFPLAARHRLPIFASPLINPPDKLKAGLVWRPHLS